VKPRKPSPGGVHLLLFPTWKSLCKKLAAKASDGGEFLALPKPEQRKFYIRLSVIAASRHLNSVTGKWLAECYQQFPEVTLLALQKLRERLATFGPAQRDQFMAALGYVPTKLNSAQSAAMYQVRKAAAELDAMKEPSTSGDFNTELRAHFKKAYGVKIRPRKRLFPEMTEKEYAEAKAQAAARATAKPEIGT
jgi:hypothetical protein